MTYLGTVDTNFTPQSDAVCECAPGWGELWLVLEDRNACETLVFRACLIDRAGLAIGLVLASASDGALEDGVEGSTRTFFPPVRLKMYLLKISI